MLLRARIFNFRGATLNQCSLNIDSILDFPVASCSVSEQRIW